MSGYTAPDGAHSIKRAPLAALAALIGALHLPSAHAQAIRPAPPARTYDIPAGDLGRALSLYAGYAGILLSFDSGLTRGRTTQGLRGHYELMQGFDLLLRDSGLEIVRDGNGRYQLRPETLQAPEQQKAADEPPPTITLDTVNVRAKRFYEVGPLPGLALTKEEIPGNVQTLTAKDIKEAHTLTLTDLMNQKLQSVTVNDYQSNPFQMDLQYRGFTASPQLGTAQGISVFLDGIRVNEPFGDVVNWDMIPMNALSGLDIFPGSNPMFGLGTLGGALVMRTRSGFDGRSLDAEILTGSFGRKQLQVSAGDNNGTVAGFVSGNFFLEDGWREDSPSKVNQVFAKGEWQGKDVRLSLSALYAGNKLTGNGLLPEQMIADDPRQVYTSQDKSRNDLLQFQLSGIWDVSDTFNITGQIYNRKSRRKSRTADVNENFGGSEHGPASATIRDRNRQILRGLPDVNNDGLPDYNNYAYNVAADANGFALDANGNAALVDDGSGGWMDNPLFDVNNLAYGTRFSDQAVAGQAQVFAADGSGNMVWNWTVDPRRDIDLQNFGTPSVIPGALNGAVTPEYAALVRQQFENRGVINLTNNQLGMLAPDIHPGSGGPSYHYFNMNRWDDGVLGAYTDENGFYHEYWELMAINRNNVPDSYGAVTGVEQLPHIAPVVNDANGRYIARDGRLGAGGGVETGWIEGTPTAIFTDTDIDQFSKGASLQFNWNLDRHKFMLGASIDKSDSDYLSKQYLGLLDANRHGYVAPDQLGWEYYANSPEHGLPLNDFTGDSLTRSLYFSETWSPVPTLSFTLSARYNRTYVNNALAVNRLSSFGDVNRVLNVLNLPVLCPDSNGDGVVDPDTECPNGLEDYIVLFDPAWANVDAFGQPIASLRPFEVEKFKYRSFNPSVGATWQARENLNVYANVGRGARTPSVIELGCAYDPTPNADGTPRSIAEQRVCNLPGAMSGDPYLKQVRSTSIELGARGMLSDNIEWNASVYRTDLSDDIYFVAVNATSSYFQNIGDTRRQGLEMGVKGRWGKASFGVNYALTDATFETPMRMLSLHNSSAYNVYDIDNRDRGRFGSIDVKPGDRMPGVALHNINATFAYDVTDRWRVGLSAVMHSDAFVRGNENNRHQAGPARPIISNACYDPATGTFTLTCEIPRADFGSGKTPGYAVFNVYTSYKLSRDWTLGLRINNLFDKEYASAGRLGINAFSPSIRGAIGPSGFNYNSADWQGASFLGTGAPRAAWVTLSYQFDPR